MNSLFTRNIKSLIVLVLLCLANVNAQAQRDCYNLPKELTPKLEALLKGKSNTFLTARRTHGYVLELTQKLPENTDEKEALLTERYFKYLEEVEADLNTLRNTLRTKGILTSNMRVAGALESESQIVKSNRPKGFAAPLPKDEQIHVEIKSILLVVDNNTGAYSKRMLINAYVLENNGQFSLMKIDSNPVSDLENHKSLIKNLKVNIPELLSYASYQGDELKNIHQKGGELAQLQVNGEGSTTVLVESDEDIRGLLAHSTAVKITFLEGVERTKLSKILKEVQGILSHFGKGTGREMNSLTGRIEKDKQVPYTYQFISKSAFRKEGDDVIKYFRICYTRDNRAESIAARLIVSPDENGTYRMDLIVGKVEK